MSTTTTRPLLWQYPFISFPHISGGTSVSVAAALAHRPATLPSTSACRIAFQASSFRRSCSSSLLLADAVTAFSSPSDQTSGGSSLYRGAAFCPREKISPSLKSERYPAPAIGRGSGTALSIILRAASRLAVASASSLVSSVDAHLSRFCCLAIISTDSDSQTNPVGRIMATAHLHHAPCRTAGKPRGAPRFVGWPAYSCGFG